MEEAPGAPVDAWRRLLATAGRGKLNIFFLVFTLILAALSFYQDQLAVGLFILAFGVFHAARIEFLLAFLLASWIRRRRGLSSTE